MKLIICLLFCLSALIDAKLGRKDSSFSEDSRVRIGNGKTHKYSRSGFEVDSSGVNIRSETRSYTDNSIVIVEDIKATGNQKINIGNKKNTDSKDIEDISLRSRDNFDRNDRKNKKRLGDIIATGNSEVNIGNFDRSKRNVEVLNESTDRTKRGIWDVKIDVKNTWTKNNGMEFRDTKGEGGSTVNVGNGDRSKRSISEDTLTGDDNLRNEQKSIVGAQVPEPKLRQERSNVQIRTQNIVRKDNSMVFNNVYAQGSTVNIGNGDRSKRSMSESPVSDAKHHFERSNVHIDTQNKIYKDNSIHVNGVNTYGSAVINIGNGKRSKKSVGPGAVNGLTDRTKRGVWDVKVDVKNTWNKDNSMQFRDTVGKDKSIVNVGNGDRSKRNVEAASANNRTKRGVWDVKIDVKNTWNKDNSMQFRNTVGKGGSTVNVGNGDRS